MRFDLSVLTLAEPKIIIIIIMYWNSLRREHHLKNECVFGSMCWRGLPVYDQVAAFSFLFFTENKSPFLSLFFWDLCTCIIWIDNSAFTSFARSIRSIHALHSYTVRAYLQNEDRANNVYFYVDLVWVLAFIWPRPRCSVALLFSSETHKNHQYHRMHPIHGQGLLRAFQMIEALNLFFFGC